MLGIGSIPDEFSPIDFTEICSESLQKISAIDDSKRIHCHSRNLEGPCALGDRDGLSSLEMCSRVRLQNLRLENSSCIVRVGSLHGT